MHRGECPGVRVHRGAQRAVGMVSLFIALKDNVAVNGQRRKWQVSYHRRHIFEGTANFTRDKGTAVRVGQFKIIAALESLPASYGCSQTSRKPEDLSGLKIFRGCSIHNSRRSHNREFSEFRAICVRFRRILCHCLEILRKIPKSVGAPDSSSGTSSFSISAPVTTSHGLKQKTSEE